MRKQLEALGCLETSVSLALLLAALGALPGAAAAVQRIEIEEAHFAFRLPDDWEAIPESSLRESIKGYRWGFQHVSRRRLVDLPVILLDYQPLQITPDTPRQWQNALDGESSYDGERHLLAASRPLTEGGWRNAVAKRAVFFGRGGAAIFYFVSSERDLERYRADFDGVIDSFAFDPGYDWRPHLARRLATAGALVALLVGLGVYFQRRFTRDAE